MAEISKITALDGTTYDIKDIYAREGIPFGIVDSTSTSTAFTATVPGITEYRDGTCVLLKNGVITSAETFTININGLGAKPSYNNMAAATRDTTIFNANYTMLFVYDSTRVSGGAWICYRGYNSDTNTIGYQLRTNSTIMQTTDTCRYYKMFFTSANGKNWVPASADSTNNATSARAVNQKPIDPFGRISYTSASTKYSANADVAAATLWEQYNLTLGYSFNRTGSALTLTSKNPVYLKCAPQANGSAIMDADTPIVQTLPSSADGKIYIFLGIATSATAMELIPMHPVYYHDGTGIRIWTGKAIPTKVSELSNDLNFVDAAGASAAAPVQSVNGQTGSVSIAIPSKVSDLSNDLSFVDAAGASAAAPVQSVNGQTGSVTIAIPSKASDVGALPSNTTYVSTVNGASGAVTVYGIPSGGINGQSLVKTSSSDYAVAWATVSGGGGIAENGLPAGGAAGQFLKKNSTTNYDTTWATVSAADVGALPTSTTYVSTVNGSSGAVTLSIPSISVSQNLSSGTKIGSITIDGATTSLYAPTDTDTKVTQTATTSSGYTYWRPLIIGDSSSSTETGAFATSTNAVRAFDILRVQPSTGTIKALNFKGNLTGTASGNYSASNPPPYPVTSVNGNTGAVTIAIPSTAADVGALPSTTTYVSTVNGSSGAVIIDGVLPSGGDTNQVLKKTSNTDYAVAWATTSAADVGAVSTNDVQFKIYNSVTDLGYTVGSSATTIANVYSSMPSSSILIANAGEFLSSEVPHVYGIVKITKIETSRPDIEFISKYTSGGFYRMGMSSGETISGSSWDQVYVPPGGNNGSLLAKSSNDDYSTAWTSELSPDLAYAAPSNTLIKASAGKIIQSPIPKYLWHDLWAFCRTATPTYYTTTDGSTWTEATLNKVLFNQTACTFVEIINDSIYGSRWVWNSSGFWYGGAEWLLMSIGYNQGGYPYFDITLEQYKNDAWETLLSATHIQYNQMPGWFKCVSPTQATQIRLTIIKNSSDTSTGTAIRVSSLRWLSCRWGDQGKGAEYEFPYDWDTTPNIYPIVDNTQSLGTSSKKWWNVWTSRINNVPVTDIYVVSTAPSSASPDGLYFVVSS